MGKFSDVDIRAWIKNDERFESRHDGSGLNLRFRSTDRSPRWFLRYHFAGEPRVLHMGTYAKLSLAEARKVAKGMRARITLGYDVAAEKAQRQRDAASKKRADRAAINVSELADQYLAKYR